MNRAVRGAIASRRRGRPAAIACAAAAIACALASPARAQSKQECADAYTQGQVARRAGKLRDARAKFEACSAAACPAALRRDCVPWSAELEKQIATIVVRVVDDRGQPVDSARVTLDGAEVSTSGPLPLDPGEHVLHADAKGFASGDARVTLAAGDHERDVVVHLGAAAPAPPPDSALARPVPTLVIALGGAAGVGVALFAVLGAVGSAKKSDLETSGCAPNCSRSSVDAIKTEFILADVSLGVGAAALATAAVLFFTRPTVDLRATQTAERPLRIDATALPSGAGARATLRF